MSTVLESRTAASLRRPFFSDGADLDGQPVLARETTQVFGKHEHAKDGTLVLACEYLEVLIQRA